MLGFTKNVDRSLLGRAVMLRLKKETVIVKDSIYDTVEDAGSIYRRIRVQDESGKTAFFKE